MKANKNNKTIEKINNSIDYLNRLSCGYDEKIGGYDEKTLIKQTKKLLKEYRKTLIDSAKDYLVYLVDPKTEKPAIFLDHHGYYIPIFNYLDLNSNDVTKNPIEIANILDFESNLSIIKDYGLNYKNVKKLLNGILLNKKCFNEVLSLYEENYGKEVTLRAVVILDRDSKKFEYILKQQFTL